jgi:exodeoxyribonuclease-1
MNNLTFLWHDYETFGINPRLDRPAQFAAIRTDSELNEIDEPIVLYCQPTPDFLPQPEACLITGITPQVCLEKGIPEHAFAKQIEALFSQPNTIGVGYNSIRFDDEVTRFLFWRNLIDPYAREWQNGCSRWDILDMVRATYALRPEGIIWPTLEDGTPSFKLEHLTQNNHITHEHAHDALSDVRATIALAKLIREKQPKLFEFCLSLRKKEFAAAEIGLPTKRPFLHISGIFPAKEGCLAIMWPLAIHPYNKNELIAWNLTHDPSVLLSLDATNISQRLFSKTEDLPEGVTRLPIKSIHFNKSPIVIHNLNVLSAQHIAQWGIDITRIQAHQAIAQTLPSFDTLWKKVYQRIIEKNTDVDESLYTEFLKANDRNTLNRLRHLTPEQLAIAHPFFDDPRLDELLFRYRARNFPNTLNAHEQTQWHQHQIERLIEGKQNSLNLSTFLEKIASLKINADSVQLTCLNQLTEYAIHLSSRLPS